MHLPSRHGPLTVVDGVDYRVEPGTVFGVAGESGSGKTMSVSALLGLLPSGARTEGRAHYGGSDLLRLPRRRLRSIRGAEIGMVFQDPTTSLHPMMTIGRQLTEHTTRHLAISAREARGRATDLLREVRIPDPGGALDAFPHQFSGGMRQRLAIAIALAASPKLLVADEPTTGLDVTVQAGLLRLLDELREKNGLAVILITHDLGVMSAIADEVSVMYAGRIVEHGSRRAVLRSPRHPYTRALLAALPHPESTSATALESIPGAPPTARRFPSGCPFHPRCAFAIRQCVEVRPALHVGGAQAFACDVDPFQGAAE